MADKTEKKPEAAPAGAGDKPDAHGGGAKKGGAAAGAGLLTKTPVLMGAVMLIEAVVLFAGFKFLGGGGPKNASAAAETSADGKGGGHGADGHGPGKGGPGDRKKSVELAVVDFRGTNKVSGRTLLFDVSIFVVTGGEKAEAVKTAIGERSALIKDRVRTIIAQSDPEKLSGGSEPGLETLRRQVKYQLDEIIGEGMIDDVLVPRCIPFRAEY